MTATAQINTGIADKDRKKIVEGLSRLLADTYLFYLEVHHFHWNVIGLMFNMLHLMLETQYSELWNAVGPVAGRVRALGYPTPGSYSKFAKLSLIPESKGISEAMGMVRELVADHEAVTRTARSLSSDADKAVDESTADPLMQCMDIHERTAWILRSLLA